MPLAGMKFFGSPFSTTWLALMRNSFTLAVFGLGPVQKEQNAWSASVVEKVFGQVDDAFDEVLLDEPLADGPFLILVGVAAATGSAARVEDDCGPAVLVQRAENVLCPAPIGRLRAWKAGPLRESAKLVGIVILFLEPVLVPHRIGDNAIERLELVADA